ncbi:hypothetical protein BGW37DRAFT_471576 [Umbelopsis sp. PMI_123]|nr:hypothetical protein BGW37DRAFT_471576 [Umbelopsis sp. PMI_123]
MESRPTKGDFNQEQPQGRQALNIANLLCTTDENEQPFKLPNMNIPPSPQSESSSPGTPVQEYLESALYQPSTSAAGIYRHTMLPFRPELTRSISLPPPSSISLPSIMDMDLDNGNNYKFHTKRSSVESPYEYDSALRDEPFGDADAIRYSQILKAKRKRANAYQLDVLNRVFEQTFFPSTELRTELGKQLGMSPRTVQIWFQNKRQSIRTRQRVASERQQQYMAGRYT